MLNLNLQYIREKLNLIMMEARPKKKVMFQIINVFVQTGFRTKISKLR